ncbi:hypothetical protein [Sorangium sp. So ce124]|uniref:hypothetical protein n=1 Tax=Sorangium sp. So ce124 TaxID=3133280 RepID=UPI003F63F1AC
MNGSRDEDDAAALGALSDAALELGAFQVAAQATQRMVDQRPGALTVRARSGARGALGVNTRGVPWW